MKNKIYLSLENGKLAWISQFIIFVYIIMFTLNTMPNISINHSIYYIFTFFFTCDYFLRVFVTPNKTKYCFSLWGTIDLISILPFSLIGINNNQIIRIFRILRILKIFKNSTINNSIIKLKKAFIIIKADLILFTSLASFLLYISATFIYFCEHSTQPDKFSFIPA